MINNKELRKQLSIRDRIIEDLIKETRRLRKENRRLYKDNCSKEVEIEYLKDLINSYEASFEFKHNSAHGFKQENEDWGGR